MSHLFILKTEGGIALIAAIFMIVVFGFIGISIVSLVGTQGFSAMNEVKSDQAFFIAEGGAEFAQRALAVNLDWYRSSVDPILIPATNLGAGAFNVSVNLPVTMLRARIPDAASTAAITVYTTDRFPTSGVIQIEDDITTGEYVRYTGISGNTFTGITRDWAVFGISGTANPHDRGDRVYPVTTLSVGLANSCASLVSISLAAHPKFLGAGTIDIEGEEISYTGSSTVAGTLTLTGVSRCQNGTGSAAHAAGVPVTPIQVDLGAPDFETEVISTGTVGLLSGNAGRVVRKSVQR